MRLFFAFPPPKSTIKYLQQHLQKLVKNFPHWDWIAPRDWHITILFLPQVSAAKERELITEAKKIFSHFSGFSFTSSEWKFFPSFHSHLLFLSLTSSPPLYPLQQQLKKLAEKLELGPTSFHPPHLTVARKIKIKSNNLKGLSKELNSFSPFSWVNTKIVLYQSLRQYQLHYWPRDEFYLKK